MRRRAVVAIALSAYVACLGIAASVQGAYRPPELSKIVSAFALRPVKVECRTEVEDPILVDAWGYVYVPTSKQRITFVRASACRGALDIATDAQCDPERGITVPEVCSTDFTKAIGAMVLVHEAYHLRRVPNNQNEAITECRAMRHYDVALRLLGATDVVMDRLMPIMLQQHAYLRARVPAYNWERCGFPERYDRWRGYPPREAGEN